MFGDFTTESPKHPSRAHRSSDTTNSTLSFSAAGADRLDHHATAKEITTNLTKKTVRLILAVLVVELAVEAHNFYGLRLSAARISVHQFEDFKALHVVAGLGQLGEVSLQVEVCVRELELAGFGPDIRLDLRHSFNSGQITAHGSGTAASGHPWQTQSDQLPVICFES